MRTAGPIFVAVMLLLGAAMSVSAQVRDASPAGFAWGMRFDTRFDNREYSALGYSDVRSQTFFSTRLAPVVGIGWGGENLGRKNYRHRVMTGGSFTLDMGAPSSHARAIEPLVFYNLDSRDVSVFVGKFERRHLRGAYSRAIYMPDMAFYDNVIDGFALQLHRRGVELELVLDWNGMRSESVRESFRVLSAGKYSPRHLPAMRWFSAGYSLSVYHLASRTGVRDGVVESVIVNPWIGASFERFAPWFERLSLSVGWLNSFDRDRMGENRWLAPGGATVVFDVRKWKTGIQNSLYYGGRQMPLWGTYGSEIYKGDPLQGKSRFHNYTRLYWNPSVGRGVSINLEVGIHTDGKHIGIQQVGGIGVTFDNEFFRRRR